MKVGKRLLIHQWAVNRLLNTTGLCPQCGRHWDDKLVLQELQENERKAEEVPHFSTGGLRGGLDCREALNELREEGSEKVTLKDVSGKGLPRPKKRTDPRSYEEALKDLWGDDEAAKGGEAA